MNFWSLTICFSASRMIEYCRIVRRSAVTVLWYTLHGDSSAVARQKFSFGGCSPEGMGMEVPLVELGRSLGLGSGVRPPKLKKYADTVCRF